MSTKLSVNVNKIATLRNARGGNVPDLLQVAMDCEAFGADGITVHPRPDERHVRYADVIALKPLIKGEFNIEGCPSKRFIDLVLSVRPTQVTLVPDPPEALTSNAGWDVQTHFDELVDKIDVFKEHHIRTSIFVGTDLANMELAAKTGTDRVELYTEPYASSFPSDPDLALEPFIKAALLANALGLGVNAGHDLNLHNLAAFKQHIPFLKEVSIGHALICDALYLSLERTIALYKQQLK
ncbi:MAG: pyridoxine 5'-phosphate synthase [Tannerellaceae bacterium]|jgi:pyridoxine 5-phosphate synthase|nr:pyridoxine 5'-phosphate synthase [Tannerellaceae bacterium]